MKLDFDVIVIGSGVAGMTAAIYLKRAGKTVAVIEKGAPGGQINKSFKVENYPGFVEIDGPSLAMNIYEQMTKLGVSYEYGEVSKIEEQENVLVVVTDRDRYHCKKVVVATGRDSRKLPIDRFDSFVSHGISYCALCDGMFFKEKDVVVVGGGNSAFEDALYLSSICAHVTVLNRSDRLRADQVLIEEVKAKQNIELRLGMQIQELIGESVIEGVLLSNGEKLSCNGIFVAIGAVPNSQFLDSLNLDMEDGYLIVNEKMQTSNPNIYACGDAIKKSVYQLTTAVGEAATAATSL